jgi:SAM-dependent methyltransferase
MKPGCQVLDLGCGNGMISEYLAGLTGAEFTGIDYIPEAIRQAEQRCNLLSPDLRARLHFQVMDMASLDFPSASFDVAIAIDTLYFTPLEDTLRQVFRLLRPGGLLLAFYSQSCEPWKSLETFDRSTTRADNTDLARAASALGLAFETWEYTNADGDHARRKRQIANELHAAFAAEGHASLVEGYLGESGGVLHAIENAAHGRYLYRLTAVTNLLIANDCR